MLINATLLTELRSIYELSQTEFAALCGVTPSYVNMIERGKRIVTNRISAAIVTEFELTEEKLADLRRSYNREKAHCVAEVARQKIRGKEAT
ncbi:helix-turn-helix transcriptional regulator [Paenibacillus kribbensis]|uniref:helix-turn-helix transcriptional regulator n=1 Tax=Paenibacillus kribbensis TaxID=172713 RepID=UPI001ABF069F|nr:helix-turn-helix transcriptional regulator [Paenibacillus kribbensis]